MESPHEVAAEAVGIENSCATVGAGGEIMQMVKTITVVLSGHPGILHRTHGTILHVCATRGELNNPRLEAEGFRAAWHELRYTIDYALYLQRCRLEDD